MAGLQTRKKFNNRRPLVDIKSLQQAQPLLFILSNLFTTMKLDQSPWYLHQSDKELIEKFRFIQHKEDERLRDATMDTAHSRWSLGVSVLPQNDARNRYVNIMPYERNRVKLKVVQGNDYINASYVKVQIPGQSLSPGRYIATQGPTENTWGQFWQMCYHECPGPDIVIVMVTPLEEHGRQKCYPYWPRGTKNGDKIKVASKLQMPGGPEGFSEFADDICVEYRDSSRIQNSYVLTTLKLKPLSGKGPTKTVHHFYFDLWRDMSKPDQVVPIMELCKHSHSLNPKVNPIVVHCSAGVGRSGTFIALDHLMNDTADFKVGLATMDHAITPVVHYDHDLVEQIVLQLRTQRLKMVQMIDQYLFIYHAANYLYTVLGSRKAT